MADIVLKDRDGTLTTHEGVTAVNLLLADGTEYIAPIITGDDGGSIANLHFAYNTYEEVLSYSSSVSKVVTLSVTIPADAKIQKVLLGSYLREGTGTNHNSTGPISTINESTAYTVNTGTDKITVTASASVYKPYRYYGGFSMLVIVIYTV